MHLFTIGFTKKSAVGFFTSLRRAGIRRLVDVRLNNVSQLAGFAKRGDLEFFLHELVGAEYVHELRLAPRAEQLEAYRDARLPWDAYAESYIALLHERDIARTLPRSLFDVPSVLLCSEATADRCHRRLAAEYLAEAWGDVTITHL